MRPNILQHLLLTCDAYITKTQPTNKDTAAADFLAGSLYALKFAPHGFNPPLPEVMERIYLINLGGYQRIHSMAQDIITSTQNAGETNPRNEAKGN